MTNRLIQGGFTAASISFVFFLALYGAITHLDVEILCLNFLSIEARPLCSTIGSDIQETAMGVGVLALILAFCSSAAWLIWLAFSAAVETPSDVRRKRPTWLSLLIAGSTVAGGAGYWMSTGIVELTRIGMGAATILGTAIFLVGFIVVTLFATPYMLRGAVPFGTALGGWLRFP